METSRTGFEKAIGHVPDAVWAPAAAALLTAVLGAFAVIAGNPALLPALGATIFLQTYRPAHRSARLYNVLVGHAVGLAAAIVGVFVSGVLGEPAAAESARMRPEEVGAALIAMPLVLIVQRLAKAVHPPAAVTALLVAVGSFSVSFIGLTVLVAGVVLIAAAGEALRQLRLRASTKSAAEF